MRKAELATKIISAVVVLAVVAYMTVYIISALSNPLETAEAVLATAEDTVAIDGWFARTEERLYAASGGATLAVRDEGEKVAEGESLIVSYTSVEGRRARERISELDARIAELETARGESGVGDINRINEELESKISDLAYRVSTGAFDAAVEDAGKLGTLILRRDYSSGRYGEDMLEEAVEELKEERSRLEANLSGSEISVYAKRSGYFSSAADGYEELLTFDSVLDMTPADVHALETADVSAGGSCGRLVTSFGWRFVSAMKEADAKQLTEGSWVTMRFNGEFTGEVRVRVYQIGEPQDSECAVVFSCATDITPVIGLRREQAELVLREYEGVRVPKAAVRVDEDGNAGVYTFVAMQTNFVKIDIATAYETENYYIVSYDASDAGSIRPGDEIIVHSKNLYDGKVIE